LGYLDGRDLIAAWAAPLEAGFSVKRNRLRRQFRSVSL
jgi:hypothetical protein